MSNDPHDSRKEEFWACNIDNRGRMARALIGLVALAGAALLFWGFDSVFWSTGLLAVGLVSLFESLRGWCVARAFGIKTPL